MAPETVGTVTGLTQMGGEGAQWIGMAPFLAERKHLLQNIGDGTFHHSGSLAVRAAVAAGVNVTYKLLYNSAVAMTGGQQAAGAMAVPALTRMLLAEGVRRVIVTTEDVSRYRGVRLAPGVQVWHRDRIVAAQEELSRVPGVTVLIHDQECATELRRKRKRGLAPDPVARIMINERICEGCGDCGVKSNCLSVQPADTEFGRKTAIDQSSCNKDYSCVAGDCPSFVSIVADKRTRKGGGRSDARVLEAGDVPDPAGIASLATGPHTTRITGIGGSGVVTLAQVLTAAGLLAGREVRTLDQTGLAQKGGAVVSDIKISATAIDQGNKATAGECDLYLGCDLLVAADARNLAVTDPGRTVAVVSTSRVPTGAMVANTAARFPDVDGVSARIRQATRPLRSIFVDARKLSVTLLGSDQFANMFLTGAAFQAGALPLPGWRDRGGDRAQRGAGAAEPAGLPAGTAARRRPGRRSRPRSPRWSRQRPALSRRPPSARSSTRSAALPARSSRRLLTTRVPDLAAYQDLGYARDYARVRRPGAREPSSALARARSFPRRSPGTCTSSWPTRTSTKSPGFRSTRGTRRRCAPHSARTRRSTTCSTRRSCARSAGRESFASAPGSGRRSSPCAR